MPPRTFPIRRVVEVPGHPLERRRWPGTLAPVSQVLDHGLDLTPATILVGENGSGKSTLVEAIALAYGVSRFLNWRWIGSVAAGYGFSTNPSQRSRSRDALASSQS
ncbi:AAA family ATPase [Paenarthrobacter ureafaciens]|uniref:AAA family ATPase n=1 Tax=Paenarthrobacter ureafaciens TaxID=37931 RepID=UPI003C6E1A64